MPEYYAHYIFSIFSFYANSKHLYISVMVELLSKYVDPTARF